jgi:hypothetical protein
MKFASKTVATAVLAAAALSGLAGAASAQEAYAVTKYEYVKTDGVETNALSFGLSGNYESGFSYDMKLMSAETAGVAWKGADVELGYRFSGIAGPVAIYEYRESMGVDMDQLLLGVEGGTVMGDVALSGKLVFDTDDSDVYRIAAAADYMVNEDVLLTGELTHFENGAGSDVNLIEVGARYKLMGNMHADVGAHYGRQSGGVDQTGMHLGLGFDF